MSKRKRDPLEDILDDDGAADVLEELTEEADGD